MNLCEDEFREICLKAKQVRNPFNTVREKASRPLQLIHSDLCGPLEPQTHDGKNYFLTCIDDFTHFCKVYLLKAKCKVFTFLKEYVTEAEAHFNVKSSKIRSDNGGEYIATGLKQWCKSKGIFIDYTIAYTPQLNGTAERMNRTLMEKARAMIFDSDSPKEMWGEAVQTAAYLLNKSPTVTISDSTPAEKWFGRKPDLSRIQFFGCIAYVKVLGPLKKLDARSKEAIFVGYTVKWIQTMGSNEKKNIFLKRCIF